MQEAICAVEDCGALVLARGWCTKHYQRWRSHGDPLKKIGKGYRVGGKTWEEAEALKEQGLWKCSGCERTMPISEFYKTGHKVNSACKLCVRLARHHITYRRYTDLLGDQGGICAIGGCDRDVAAIDHDHNCCSGEYSCGDCVRGLLCTPHNQGLGFFRDDTDALYAAAEYLNNYSERHAYGQVPA